MLILFDRIIEYGIILLIVFTPLAMGTVLPWSYTIMGLTICFLAIICTIKLIFIKIKKLTTTSKTQSHNYQSPFPTNRFGLTKTPLNIPFILLIGLIVFQLIPLSPGFLKVVSPNTYDLYRNTLPGWSDKSPSSSGQITTDIEHTTFSVSQTVNNNREHYSDKSAIQKEPVVNSKWMPISIYPYATKMELFSILIFIGMFLLITNTPEIRINRIIVVIVSLGFSISLLGIMQKLTGTKKPYWVVESFSEFPFGPYINRNHFAGYICMVIPLALGLLISRFRSFFSSRKLNFKAAEFQSHLFANLLLVFAIVIMILALFISLSRGGILVFLFSTAAFFIIIVISRLVTGNNKGIKISSFVLSVLIAFSLLIWIGHNTILDRLSDPSSPTSTRISLYLDTLNISSDFPIFGTGFGTFQHIYRKYKTVDDRFFYEHTHNDYLEVLSDLGLIGFLIVLVGIVLFLRKILLRWVERRDPYAKGITLGGVCGVFAILSHSLVDFNLHIPANALFLSIILGLIFNTVHLKRNRG
jgi:O-antigen ligase